MSEIANQTIDIELKGDASHPNYRKYLETVCAVDPQLFIELTSYCNFSCFYCSSKNSKRKSVMSDETFYSVLDQVKDITNQPIRLHCDGEPTLHNKFLEYVTAINEQGMRIALVSNGSKLSNEYLTLGMDIAINLSTSEEEFNKRYAGSFDLYLKRQREYIRSWYDLNSDQNLTYNIYLSSEQRKSKDELSRITDFIYNFLTDIGFILNTAKALTPTSEFIKITNAKNRHLRIMAANIASSGTFPVTEQLKLRVLPKDFGFCDAFWKRLVILADGRIQTCCHDLFGTLAYTNIEDLNNKSLRELWLNDERINTTRSKVLQGVITHPICQKCLDRLPDREFYTRFIKDFDKTELAEL